MPHTLGPPSPTTSSPDRARSRPTGSRPLRAEPGRVSGDCTLRVERDAVGGAGRGSLGGTSRRPGGGVGVGFGAGGFGAGGGLRGAGGPAVHPLRHPPRCRLQLRDPVGGPEEQQPERVLARKLPARATAPVGGLGEVDARQIGLGPAAPALPEHDQARRAVGRPFAWRRHPLRRLAGRRVRGEGEDLIPAPPLHHLPQTSQPDRHLGARPARRLPRSLLARLQPGPGRPVARPAPVRNVRRSGTSGPGVLARNVQARNVQARNIHRPEPP